MFHNCLSLTLNVKAFNVASTAVMKMVWIKDALKYVYISTG